jgi:hypothetical protein
MTVTAMTRPSTTQRQTASRRVGGTGGSRRRGRGLGRCVGFLGRLERRHGGLRGIPLGTQRPDRLGLADELVGLALAREAASRNSRGIFTLSNGALGELTGLTENVVSQIMQDLAARDGTPFERLVTRVPCAAGRTWACPREGMACRSESVASGARRAG